jgi:hypothetical protein
VQCLGARHCRRPRPGASPSVFSSRHGDFLCLFLGRQQVVAAHLIPPRTVAAVVLYHGRGGHARPNLTGVRSPGTRRSSLAKSVERQWPSPTPTVVASHRKKGAGTGERAGGGRTRRCTATVPLRLRCSTAVGWHYIYLQYVCSHLPK